MKNIILAVALSLLPATTFADGHNGHGQGFASTVSSTTIEGKSGSITHMISEDIWQYQKAPEGWPKAAMATCHYTILMEAGQQAPSSINGVCVLPFEIINAVCCIDLICGLKTWFQIDIAIFSSTAGQVSCSLACAGINGSKPN